MVTPIYDVTQNKLSLEKNLHATARTRKEYTQIDIKSVDFVLPKVIIFF